MGTLIDSSVLVEAERGRLNLDATLARYPEEQFSIAAITTSEMLHGLHGAAREEHRAGREVFVEGLLARFRVVPFDLEAARVHARVGAQMMAKGQPVGSHDLIIAATAIAIGAHVATRDERSFPRIPGLSLLLW